MPQPTEHKTVQARILQYAQDIGWTFVSRSQAEEMRNFIAEGRDIKERCRTASLYFEDTLYQKIKEFNPRYQESQGALLGDFRLLPADIYGSRDFIKYLKNEATFFIRKKTAISISK